MSRPRRQVRAVMLLELMLAIAVAMVVIAVLGKLLLDGIYLQRIAWERASRVAIADALTDRLRADALGTISHTWGRNASGLTLRLQGCADGSPQRVQWVFGQDEVLRSVDGREAGSFSAERLSFSTQVERPSRGDFSTLSSISAWMRCRMARAASSAAWAAITWDLAEPSAASAAATRASEAATAARAASNCAR